MVEAKIGFDAVRELWGYNRDNFLYDRRMRQEQELKLAEWRCTQAELWREDVRDLVGLTERKMDSYLVVNTLQLGMCVALFTEGRLKPGTPHWLLHFYMLTLGAAFMYLLMSVWLAMHASVVAACENVRLLTQSVRLPIPTWEQLESMRTYASSYETLGRKQLRIPFIDQMIKKSGSEDVSKKGSSSSGAADPAHSACAAANASTTSAAANASPNMGVAPESLPAESRLEGAPPANGATHGGVDTWGLESKGEEIYELQRRPLVANRHVNLVKRAATHYQCHDAFARVAMSFGTNQLLFAITYYCMGYVSVGDGAPWPAAIIAIIMSGIAAALVKLDFSFSKFEHWRAMLLLLTGPVCSSFATCAWSTHSPRLETVTLVLLPIAYLAHGFWLLWALRACKVELHPDGEMLPTKFRTVLYLDVFGWLHHKKPEQKAKPPIKTMAAFDDPGGNYMAMPLSQEDTYSPPATPFTQAPEKDFMKCNELNKPLTCTVLPAGSAGACTSFSDVAGVNVLLEDCVKQNLAVCQSEDAQRLMDEDMKARVDALARRFYAVSGEVTVPGFDSLDGKGPCEKTCSSSEPSSEPDSEPYVDSRQRTFREGKLSSGDSVSTMPGISASNLPSNRSSSCQDAAPALPGRWQEMRYYTDFGTEVPYLYDPQTGQVQHSFVGGVRSRSVSRDFLGADADAERESAAEGADVGELIFSMSCAEECIERLERSLCEGSKLPKSQAREVSDDVPVPPDPFNKTSFGSAAWLTDVEKQCKHAAARNLPWLLGDVEEEDDENEEEPQDNSASLPSSGRRRSRRISHLTPGEDCIHAEIIKQLKQPSSDKGGHFHSTVQSDEQINNDEVVTAMEPDKIPWKVFRNATLLLICLWGLGPAQLFGLLGGVTEFGPLWHLAADPNRISQQVRDSDPRHHAGTLTMHGRDASDYLSTLAEEDFPALPEGALLKVGWPLRAGLRANVLSSDKSGRHLVIADDFGVYAGQIRESGENDASAPSPATNSNSLRGSLSTGFEISFARAPQCTALEGQALKDIGIVCSRHNRCHVLVLHTNGQLLTQCPLLDNGKDGVERPVVTWKISGDWLDTEEEQVESVAVNDECGEDQADRSRHDFYPDEVGCVVVGTTSGRVVQLRRHVTKEHQLVPAWAMQQRDSKVEQGSLHVFPGGFVVMLRSNSIQALDARQGSVIGQWELPQVPAVRWLTICGGGNNIYLLGRDHEGKSQLWRFPVPPELQAAMLIRHQQDDPSSEM